MFKKPPTLKPSTPLRSSARRSFLTHLQELYPALATASPEVILKVVPNGLKHCNAVTSSEQKAVIYTDEQGKPLWFELGAGAGTALQQSQSKKKDQKGGAGGGAGAGGAKTETLAEVFPTVYTLWVIPTLLPRLPTWPQIVDPPLVGGSALMIPGLVPAPHTFPDGAKSGVYPSASSIISVTPYPSPIPWVVARSELGLKEICSRREAGEKGKAATTIHTKGDFLWELGGKGEPPSAEEGLAIEQALLTQATAAAEADLVEAVSTQIHDVALADEGITQANEEGGREIHQGSNSSDVLNSPMHSTAEVDAIMYVALLQALLSVSKQADGLPIQLSSLYSTHVLPNRPAHWPPKDGKGRGRSRLPHRLTPSAGQDIEALVSPDHADIKHTSAKKLSKWIKAAEKSELLKSKEVKGKDIVITSINTGHADLKDLTPFYTIQKAQREALATDATVDDKQVGEATTATAAGAKKIGGDAGPQIVVERFWKASASSVKLFQEMGASTSEALSQPTIRRYLLDFIAAHQLVDARDQAQVRLADPILVHAVYPKAQLHEIPATLNRQELLDRLLSVSCVEYHRTSRLSSSKAQQALQANSKGKASNAGSEISPEEAEGEYIGEITKGAAKLINVEIKTRQGRKIISLITNLEIYGVDAQMFAHELMKSGASASATALPTSTQKHPKYEVFVQGDQRKAIYSLLEGQGLGSKFVQVHDRTKK